MPTFSHKILREVYHQYIFTNETEAEYCLLYPHTLILESEILTQIPLQVSDVVLSYRKYDHLVLTNLLSVHCVDFKKN